MIDAGTHGAVNWVDLSTPNIGAATVFYRDVLGWTITSTTTPMGEYFIAGVGAREVAGMMAQSPSMLGDPALWTTFFFVDDIDESAEAASAAGGRVLEPPFDIPGNARVAVVADPTGAMHALIAGPRPDGTYLSRLPGAVCWVELLARDPAAAESYYATVFGWKAITDITGSTAYTMFQLDGRDVAGMMMVPNAVPAEAPSHWAVYFTVVDSAATEQKAIALGGRVLRSTTTIDIGRFAVLADPQGAKFNVMEFTA